MKPLNIFGRLIPVKKIKNLVRNEDVGGYYDFVKKYIALDQALSPDDSTRILVHEIGHAIFNRGGIMQAKLPLELEEIIVDQFATVLTENFKLTRK